jgi:hypothetical protein
MGQGKFRDGETPVTCDLDGDIGNESWIPYLPFAVAEPLVGCRFPLLNFFNNFI